MASIHSQSHTISSADNHTSAGKNVMYYGDNSNAEESFGFAVGTGGKKYIFLKTSTDVTSVEMGLVPAP